MAMLNREDIKQWLEALKFDQPLEYDDARYIDLFKVDSLGNFLLRGPDKIAEMCDIIQLGTAPTCQLFSGFVGTGKSTELKRLEHQLAQDYHVIMVDFASYHDLNHPLEIIDFAVLLAGAFGEAVEKKMGKKLMEESYWERFKSFVSEDELEIKNLKLGFATLEFKSTLKHGDAEIWREIRQGLQGTVGKIKASAHAYIKDCLQQLHKTDPSKQGTVFILDSMERLRGNELKFKEIMESVSSTFSEHTDFFRLPECHSIFTIPPYVGLLDKSLSNRFESLEDRPMPAVKVLEKDGAHYSDGIQALQALLQKRFPVDRVFLPDHAHTLEQLIVNSAGHIKTLLGFMRAMLIRLSRADTAQIPQLAERIFRDFTQGANGSIRADDIPLLEKIRQTKSLDSMIAKDIAHFSRFIDSNILMSYQNGDNWFQIHPLVSAEVARRARDLGLKTDP